MSCSPQRCLATLQRRQSVQQQHLSVLVSKSSFVRARHVPGGRSHTPAARPALSTQHPEIHHAQPHGGATYTRVRTGTQHTSQVGARTLAGWPATVRALTTAGAKVWTRNHPTPLTSCQVRLAHVAQRAQGRKGCPGRRTQRSHVSAGTDPVHTFHKDGLLKEQ